MEKPKRYRVEFPNGNSIIVDSYEVAADVLRASIYRCERTEKRRLTYEELTLWNIVDVQTKRCMSFLID